jgi:hypothetical protein
MSAIVNDRDVLLQAATVRNTNPTAGKLILITSDSTAFKVTAGVAAPAAIAMQCQLVGLTGVPTFSVTGANRLIGDGLNRTLAFADVTADSVIVTATLVSGGITYTGKQTFFRLSDGTPGLAGTPGTPGTPGVPGIKNTIAHAYQWTVSGAPTASGAAIYTWATASYDNVPATGWSAIKPPPPTVGATLYEASFGLVETKGAPTSAIDWSQASVVSIGYLGVDGKIGPPGQNGQNGKDGQPGKDGQNGANGSNGAAGSSAVICYCLIDGMSLNASPAFAAVNGNAMPATGTWGESRAWQSSIPSPAAGQSVFQTNGIYNPNINQTVWSVPYLSNLKVGNLSALSTNTGSLTVSGTISSANGNFQVAADGTMQVQSAAAGRRTVINSMGVACYDANGVLRAFIGTS